MPSNPRRRHRRHLTRRRLNLESLESRRLLTFAADFQGPSLPIIDDAATIAMGDEARIDLLANDSRKDWFYPVDWGPTRNGDFFKDLAVVWL